LTSQPPFQTPLYPYFLPSHGGRVGYSRVLTAWDTELRSRPYELQAVLSCEEPFSVLPKGWRDTHRIQYTMRGDWSNIPRWRNTDCDFGEVRFHFYVPSLKQMVPRTAHVLLPRTDPQPVPRAPILGCELLWFNKITLHLQYGLVDDETVSHWTGRELISWGWLEFR